MVKLLIDEPGTSAAQGAFQEAELIATSGITYVETRSALARMHAGGRLNAPTHLAKVKEFELLWGDLATITVGWEILARGADLAERHVLRAYDAVQLSSALVLTAADAPTFACWDTELRRAAASEGLRLIPAGT